MGRRLALAGARLPLGRAWHGGRRLRGRRGCLRGAALDSRRHCPRVGGAGRLASRCFLIIFRRQPLLLGGAAVARVVAVLRRPHRRQTSNGRRPRRVHRVIVPARSRAPPPPTLAAYQSVHARHIHLTHPPHVQVVLLSLERLFLWLSEMHEHDGSFIRLKIGNAPKLSVLGYLNPGIHVLEIRNTVVSSEKTDEVYGKVNLKFWQEAGPIESIQSCIKMMTFRAFRMEQSEVSFLKFFFQSAQVLKNAVIVGSNGSFTSFREVLSKLKAPILENQPP